MWYITRHKIKVAALAWGPLALALILSFIASAQPKFAPPVNAEPMDVYFSGMVPVFPGIWEALIKKSAHVLAFGMLAWLFMRAFLTWQMTPKQAAYLAITCTICYALLDETHQYFVPGRHASALDIGLDFIGAVLFTLAARFALSRSTRLAHARPLLR